MNIVNKFIDKMKYTYDINVEGIILYGSYQTNTNNPSSDIDIIILYNNNIKRDVKGYMRIDGTEIEYYERTLKAFYNRATNDYKNAEDTLLSAIGHGNILFDRNLETIKLQRFVLSIFEKSLPKLNDNDIAYMSKSINKAISKLKYYEEINCEYFTVYYCITLEKMREFYHRLNGYSSLTTSSVYKIYTDKRLQIIQYKTMPGENFINLYMSCLNVNNQYKREFLKRILKLYEFSIKNLNIDFNNLRINIENKNH